MNCTQDLVGLIAVGHSLGFNQVGAERNRLAYCDSIPADNRRLWLPAGSDVQKHCQKCPLGSGWIRIIVRGKVEVVDIVIGECPRAVPSAYVTLGMRTAKSSFLE